MVFIPLGQLLPLAMYPHHYGLTYYEAIFNKILSSLHLLVYTAKETLEFNFHMPSFISFLFCLGFELCHCSPIDKQLMFKHSVNRDLFCYYNLFFVSSLVLLAKLKT